MSEYIKYNMSTNFLTVMIAAYRYARREIWIVVYALWMEEGMCVYVYT